MSDSPSPRPRLASVFDTCRAVVLHQATSPQAQRAVGGPDPEAGGERGARGSGCDRRCRSRVLPTARLPMAGEGFRPRKLALCEQPASLRELRSRFLKFPRELRSRDLRSRELKAPSGECSDSCCRATSQRGWFRPSACVKDSGMPDRRGSAAFATGQVLLMSRVPKLTGTPQKIASSCCNTSAVPSFLR